MTPRAYSSARPSTLIWTRLDDQDAEAVRAEIDAGRHRAAGGLRLDRAVELISLAAAATGTTVSLR
jgi:hypothetical protein